MKDSVKLQALTYKFMVETLQQVNFCHSRVMRATAHSTNEAMMKILTAADADGLTVVNIEFYGSEPAPVGRK